MKETNDILFDLGVDSFFVFKQRNLNLNNSETPISIFFSGLFISYNQITHDK